MKNYIKNFIEWIEIKYLERQVMKQLKLEEQGKKNKLSKVYKRYDNVILVRFKRKSQELQDKYPNDESF